MTLADRIAIMRNGMIQQLAAPADIYNRPVNKYVAGFIGSPEMNFLDGRVEGASFVAGDARIPLDGYGFDGGCADGPAWFGMRPEHVAAGGAARGMPFQSESTVEIVEPMGSDTLVWTTLAGLDFRLRMDGQARVAPGDRLFIGFSPERASLFDRQTEKRL
jgi:multiple sugar transport system ATP-binding protein